MLLSRVKPGSRLFQAIVRFRFSIRHRRQRSVISLTTAPASTCSQVLLSLLLDAFGNHTPRKRLHLRNGSGPVVAVCHHAREVGHFCNPAAVLFALNLD